MHNSRTGSNKRASRLLDRLITNASASQKLSNDELGATLTNLKVEARDPREGAVTFSKESLDLLVCYGLISNPLDIRLEALRIIANALLLSPSLRKQFDTVPTLAHQYKEASANEEFVVSRIMFLLTIEPRTYDAHVLKGLHEYILLHVTRHAEGDLCESSLPALTETCKLLFNILCKFSNEPSYDDVIWPLSSIIKRLPRILNSVSCSIISCLLKLPCTFDVYFRDEAPTELSEVFFELLSKAVQRQSLDTAGLDDSIVPLLLLLSNIFSSARNAKVIEYFKAMILPSEIERSRPLGQSSSLASTLLQITSKPTFMKSREVIYQLMWDASDQDVHKFIYHIGFGYAIGYIMSHEIAVPEDLLSETAPSVPSGNINPVTGQRVENEGQIPSLANMTEDEKEREAERLFVLFERMRANGIINVENPVRTALESGRFQELPD
ncbi:guanine nucleotide exchange factor [Lipomyces chichibuensis]|uniref:guanine nucleotide exchange factor n=1 Tax=Lipomyces chichibuensis TaxID=1546026 RepID=UPI0033441520